MFKKYYICGSIKDFNDMYDYRIPWIVKESVKRRYKPFFTTTYETIKARPLILPTRTT